MPARLTDGWGRAERTFYLCKGERLRAYRQSAGLDMASLGRMVGLSESQISRIERGRRRLHLYEFVSLCIALDIHCEDVLD